MRTLLDCRRVLVFTVLRFDSAHNITTLAIIVHNGPAQAGLMSITWKGGRLRALGPESVGTSANVRDTYFFFSHPEASYACEKLRNSLQCPINLIKQIFKYFRHSFPPDQNLIER
jgi:hypothetical protein